MLNKTISVVHARFMRQAKGKIMAKVKLEVIHPKYYTMVNGKLTHVKPGSEVDVEDKKAEKLIASGKLKDNLGVIPKKDKK